MSAFRLDPQLPASAMKSYVIAAPRSSHFRAATCAEVECRHYRNGWETVIDESTDDGRAQADYIRTASGRAFREKGGGWVVNPSPDALVDMTMVDTWTKPIAPLDVEVVFYSHNDTRRHIRRTLPSGEVQFQVHDFFPSRTTFVFAAGQTCFRSDEHVVRIERPEIFLVRDGDHRGNPRGTQPRIYTTPEAWVDDFGEHQERLTETRERG